MNNGLSGLTLGDLVRCDNKLVRAGGQYSRLPFDHGSWEQGIYVGYRTVNNGYFYDELTHTEYNQTVYFPVAVVVFDARLKPVFIHPADIHLLKQGAMITYANGDAGT